MVSHDEIDQLYQVNIIQDQGLEDNIKLSISKFAEIIIILQLFQPFPVRFTIVSILTDKISTNPSTQFSPGFLQLDCHYYRLSIS